MEAEIHQAVILAAGQGTRLRRDDKDYLKPLFPLNGKPLIGHVMEIFACFGVTDFHIVLGFAQEELVPGLHKALPRGTRLHQVDNPLWRLSNGVSLLMAKDHVEGRFFLSMSDHVFQPEMLARLAEGAESAGYLYLAVDRKLDTIFDMDDATKIRSDGGRLVDIGKHLGEYDAVDTGLFVCPPAVFDCLEDAKHDGDCSLSDGVRTMATRGLARVIDIGDALWQDVDTPAMLSHAERLFSTPGPTRVRGTRTR